MLVVQVSVLPMLLDGRQGWLSEGNPELWWKQKKREKERTGFPNRANTQDVLMLSAAETGKGHGLGFPHIGSPQDRSRGGPWSWGAPTMLPCGTQSVAGSWAAPSQQQECAASQRVWAAKAELSPKRGTF